ncbi:MAG: glycosyltransferase [Terriglobales bacterium]|jgi:glycosyltransferase involved in cell wall biosynthesis
MPIPKQSPHERRHGWLKNGNPPGDFTKAERCGAKTRRGRHPPLRYSTSVKIVQAVEWYYPDGSGGTERYVSALCRKIRDAGHEVCVAAPDPQGVRTRAYWHDGIAVFRYPIPAKPSREECQGRAIVRGAEGFHEWLKQQQPDVAHFHTFGTGLGLHEIKAAKAARARVIATTHSASLGFLCQRGTMMQWGEYLCDGICEPAKCSACELQHRGLSKRMARTIAALPPAISGAANRLPGRLGSALSMSDLIAFNQQRQADMLELVDAFVVLTGWALDRVVANGAAPEKIRLNRLGVSELPSVRKPDPDCRPTSRPILVGYLGRFEAIKGVEDLARAIASLSLELPIRFEFRGPVNSAAERRLVNHLKGIIGDDSRVNFAPPVEPGAVYQVLATYDVLCCPSVCVEGGPTVALEAHAVGTPVIGTRIGGLAEIISDGTNGRLVAPGDWRELARVLNEVAGNFHTTIDEWRRELQTPRTMDQVCDEYLQLYAACREMQVA